MLDQSSGSLIEIQSNKKNNFNISQKPFLASQEINFSPYQNNSFEDSANFLPPQKAVFNQTRKNTSNFKHTRTQRTNKLNESVHV